jgi:hypothetical protein
MSDDDFRRHSVGQWSWRFIPHIDDALYEKRQSTFVLNAPAPLTFAATGNFSQWQ